MDTLSHEQQDKLDRCPPALQAIVEEFREATARERLELLLEYADSLPPLPAEYADARDRLEQVHECQTPVFLATKLEGEHVVFAIDVPPESPTVRGYAAILLEGLAGLRRRKCWPCPTISICCWGWSKSSLRSGCAACTRCWAT